MLSKISLIRLESVLLSRPKDSKPRSWPQIRDKDQDLDYRIRDQDQHRKVQDQDRMIQDQDKDQSHTVQYEYRLTIQKSGNRVIFTRLSWR